MRTPPESAAPHSGQNFDRVAILYPQLKPIGAARSGVGVGGGTGGGGGGPPPSAGVRYLECAHPHASPRGWAAPSMNNHPSPPSNAGPPLTTTLSPTHRQPRLVEEAQ